MHIGQGFNPTTCCKYTPKASKARQAMQTVTRMRRGAVSSWVNTKFKITFPVKKSRHAQHFAAS